MLQLRKSYKKSYSQCGEDIIVDFIFNTIGIEKPRYLDIGAHDPMILNNTFLFYKNKCSGVNIEPDPMLFNKFISKRRNDINLNCGIAATNKKTADFYVMTAKTLNTFSKETAERYVSYGTQRIEKKLKIDLITINDVMRGYFDPKPNYISLDVEGLELEILKSFNFDEFRPEVFCIETLTYTENKSEVKITDILDYMQSLDYMVFADTYINTIFVDLDIWKSRQPK